MQLSSLRAVAGWARCAAAGVAGPDAAATHTCASSAAPFFATSAVRASTSEPSPSATASPLSLSRACSSTAQAMLAASASASTTCNDTGGKRSSVDRTPSRSSTSHTHLGARRGEQSGKARLLLAHRRELGSLGCIGRGSQRLWRRRDGGRWRRKWDRLRRRRRGQPAGRQASRIAAAPGTPHADGCYGGRRWLGSSHGDSGGRGCLGSARRGTAAQSASSGLGLGNISSSSGGRPTCAANAPGLRGCEGSGATSSPPLLRWPPTRTTTVELFHVLPSTSLDVSSAGASAGAARRRELLARVAEPPPPPPRCWPAAVISPCSPLSEASVSAAADGR